MPSFVTSSEFLIVVAGVILSLLFSYIPKLNTWFVALDGVYKRLIMAGLILVTSVSIYFLGCGGVAQTGVTCDQAGIYTMVWYFIQAVIANQGAYLISPQTNAVKSAKTG